MTNGTGPERVAILGVGLVGGSIGLALRDIEGFATVGWDVDPSSLSTALSCGALQAAAGSPQEAVRDASLVVIATPVSATIPLLESILPALAQNAVVTDVGSTKNRLVNKAEELIGGRFVGGHPMAGSAVSGVGGATADLFQGAPWFLTPTSRTTPEALAAVTNLVESCGAAPRQCDPALHDRVVASLSHLPHLLAYCLSQTAADSVPAAWKDVAAGSFRDGTRVASSSPALWADILLDNREAVLASIDAHSRWMADVRAALESADEVVLRDMLDRAWQARRGFPLEANTSD